MLIPRYPGWQEEQRQLYQSGCCASCKGRFLAGIETGTVMSGRGQPLPFLMCFWCWEQEAQDCEMPTYQVHTGHC